MRRSIVMVFVAACLAAGAARPVAASAQEVAGGPADTAGLVGTWKLNAVLSDDPSEQIPRPAVPPGARNQEPQDPPSGTAQLRRAIERFSIEQTDSTVVMVYPDRALPLYVDGESHVDVVSDDLEIEYRAWRDGGALSVERRADGGLRLTERYSVHASTGRLHVLTRLEGDRLARPISFVRVYDPAAD
jgi:hypothetical protein